MPESATVVAHGNLKQQYKVRDRQRPTLLSTILSKADEKPLRAIKSIESGTTLTPVSGIHENLEAQKQHASSPIVPGDLDIAAVDEKPKRFKPSTRVIQDAILGLSDGMTVPFALTAGLSSLGTTRLVIIGGVAELCAGAISMGLGAYLAARTEAYVLILPTLMFPTVY